MVKQVRSHELDEAIRAAFRQGARRRDLPQQFGVSQGTVSRVLKGLSGPGIRTTGARDARNDEIARAYADGMTLEECGQRFGLAMQTVHRILQDRDDVRLRPRGISKAAHPSAYAASVATLAVRGA